MSPTTLKRIAIALVVVIFLWGATKLFTGHGDELEMATVIAPAGAAQADTIEIVQDTARIVLTRMGNHWLVDSHPTDSNVVEQLFDQLKGGVQAELVARNASSHGRTGVDSTGGAFRVITGGKVVTDLIVGDPSAGSGGRYVRPVGDERVYVLASPLADLLRRPPSDWRDHVVAALSPDSITKVNVVRGRAHYTLTRRDSTWVFGDGSPADSGAVARMLHEFADVRALGTTPFASPAQIDSIDFAHPDRRVTVLGSHGDTLTSLLFDSTASGFWVRHDSGGTVYNVLRWKANQLLPPDSTLKPKAN